MCKHYLRENPGLKKAETIRQKGDFFFRLGITTLILSSVVTLVGMAMTSGKMKAMGEQLGALTRDDVTELVSEREKENLEQLVHAKVGIMNAIFKKVSTDVKMLSESATEILSAQGNYLPKELIRTKSWEDVWALALTLTPSSVDNLDNLRGRIAMAANTQTNLKNIALSYDIKCSTYMFSEDGFGLIVDTNEGYMRANYLDNPPEYLPLNFIERFYYKNAKEKKHCDFQRQRRAIVLS